MFPLLLIMSLFSFAVVYCMFRFDGPSSGGINLNLFVVRGVGGGGGEVDHVHLCCLISDS